MAQKYDQSQPAFLAQAFCQSPVIATAPGEDHLTSIYALWGIKIVLYFQWHLEKKFLEDEDFRRLCDIPTGKIKKDVGKQLAVRNEKLNQLAQSAPPSRLAMNADILGDSMTLPAAARAIVMFVVSLEGRTTLASLISRRRTELGNHQLSGFLAHVLGYDETLVSESLHILVKHGMLSIDSDSVDLEEKLSIQRTIQRKLYSHTFSIAELLANLVALAPHSRLSLSDFPHLEVNIQILCDCLRSALVRHLRGINVLVVGPPGTGKTEFARALSQTITCKLFELVTMTDDGHPLSPNARLMCFQTAQSLAANCQDAIFVIDECDELLEIGESDNRRDNLWSAANATKSFICGVLEQNPVPAIWIANSIESLDKAILRRFGLVVQFPQTLPKHIRLSIAERYFGAWNPSRQYLDNLIAKAISPAQLQQAANVAGMVTNDPDRALEVVAHVLRDSNRLLGAAESLRRAEVSNDFSVEFLNCDIDINLIIGQFKHFKRGRALFYGPPGTGKSQSARWLSTMIAEASPVLVRATDWLSRYVGETERRILASLNEATGNAIILDEADSFLMNRQHARTNWEITQINTLLAALEDFDGYFFATTNALDTLDPAALRRFDHKVNFRYLRGEQAYKLFHHHAERICEDTSSIRLFEDRIRAFETMTPAMFRVVADKFANRHDVSVALLFEQLVQEMNAIGGRRARIGF